jgi:hypothetical protein
MARTQPCTEAGGENGELTWQVVGWRRSARLIDEVCASLTAGLDPAPAEAALDRPASQ